MSDPQPEAQPTSAPGDTMPPPPGSPPASSSSKAKLIVAGAAAVVGILVIAGGVVWAMNRAANNRYCEVYDQTHAELSEAIKDGKAAAATNPRTLDGMETQVDALKAVSDKMQNVSERRRDAAPASIRGHWEVLTKPYSSDAQTANEEKAEDDAVAAVNQFAVDQCGLEGDM